MNRDKLIRELRAVVGDEYVLVEKEDVIVYEQDGSIMQAMPEIVVLPGSAEEVAAVVRAAKQANVPIVPRGSGTGLAGGAVPAEGGVGIVTKAVLHLMRSRESVRTLLAIFDRMDAATQTVVDITAAGIVPAALEMMDRLTIEAVETGAPVGYPRDADAVLLVELEGVREFTERGAREVHEICMHHGARQVRVAQDDAERLRLWKGRKGAFGALGTLAPNYYVQDGVVPRSRLPEIMRQIATISARYHLRIANVFHAGDGNLHPNILFDMRTPGELDKVIAAGEDILRACVAVGGSITGEHGIGLEKKAYIGLLFSDADLNAMAKVRKAFDPDGRFNPAKMFPTPITCAEMRRAPAKIPAGLWI